MTTKPQALNHNTMKEHFIEEIERISSKYELRTDNEFNIFDVLFDPRNEKQSHSRFISNLLSPESKHGQKKLFLEEFLKLINSRESTNVIEYSDSDLESAKVYPNELNKSEHKHIDIYIEIKSTKIIIENKIFARDSNQTDTKGKITPQLINYYDNIKSDTPTNIYLVYLTLDGKEPSHMEEFRDKKFILIDYTQFIPNWLDKCSESITNENVRDCITQYKRALFSIVSNFNLVMELKSFVSENTQEIWSLGKESTILNTQLKHIKWHTIHEFWRELCYMLQEKLKIEIEAPTNKRITKMTHKNTKTKLMITFVHNGKSVQVINDENGFKWNLESLDKNFQFKDSNKIIFSNFDSEETFNIINIEYRKEVINKITSEIITTLTN